MRRIVVPVLCLVLLAALVAPANGTGEHPQRTSETVQRDVPAAITPGVNGDTIKIGLHAPLTGVAPLPADSVERGKDLYFRWRASRGHTINGRRVMVILRNDQHNPSTAVSVCKEMVEKERVFMLIGIIGVNQMQACARYAASQGVPYVSPGSTKLALRHLDNFFATSMTWPHQARLLADYFIERREARRSNDGALWMNSPNYEEPHRRFVAVMTRRNAPLEYDRSVPATAGAADARTAVTEMDLGEIRTVFYLHTPTWFLQVLQQAEAQGFNAFWTSLGSVIALDAVAEVACRHATPPRITSLSPWPAFDDRDRFDPAFDKAVSKFYPTGPEADDVMWQLWAQSKALEKMLDKAGRRLTRPRFMSRVERATIRTGILPTLRFRPGDHFGAAASHLLGVSCRDDRWHTIRSFVRDF